MSFSNLFSSIDLSNNWLLILIFLAVGFGYGMVLGKNRLNLITVAAYISLAITKAIPTKLGFLGLESGLDPKVQIFLFLAIILAIFFLAPHSGLGSAARLLGRGKASLWQFFVIGVLQLGLIVSIIISFLPTKAVSDLNDLTRQVFLSEEARFLWLVLPVIAMLVLRKRKEVYEK